MIPSCVLSRRDCFCVEKCHFQVYTGGRKQKLRTEPEVCIDVMENKTMKKIIVLLFVMSLMITLLTIGAVAESNVDKEIHDREIYTSGDYKYYITDNGDAIITKYIGNGIEISVPDNLDGYPVIAIEEEAFYWNHSLTKVVLPEGILQIGEKAFSICTTLKSVTLPNTLVSLTSNPFYGCGRLSEIQISPEHPGFEIKDGVLFN